MGAGYPITKISGVFDAELDQAVRAFQRDHGLGPTASLKADLGVADVSAASNSGIDEETGLEDGSQDK